MWSCGKRLYTTIENSFYSVARRPYTIATFPGGFDRGLTIDLESYDADSDTTVILETELHENNNILFLTQTSTNVTENSFLQWM